MTNNELIAEFMGVKPLHMGGSVEYEIYGILDFIEDGIDEQHFFLEEELKFHSSWDWLMPVVEKIEMLGYTFEKNYQPIDKDWQCLIVKGLDILYQEFDKSSIKSAHYVVVEFIKRTKKST